MSKPLVKKNMTIGLIGSRGQLGSDLLSRAPQQRSPALVITPLDRPEFDLTHPQSPSARSTAL